MATNTNHLLSQDETKQMALYFQSSFIAVVAANRALNFVELIKKTDKYKQNYKNIKRYCRALAEYTAQLHRSVFDGHTELKDEYLKLAGYFSNEEIVQQCTIKNTFTFNNVKDADIAAAHLHAFFLCNLAELIVKEGNIEKLAAGMGVYSTQAQCGISAIRKNLFEIADCFEIDMPKNTKLEQVFQAYIIFEDRFLSNEDLLFEIVRLNGLNVVPPTENVKNC